MIPVTSLVVLWAAILTAQGDVQRPTQGHQIGKGLGDIIFPLTITQCEPVIIYYNLTGPDYATLTTLDGYDILDLYFPAGVGYFDWICDIPTGYSFVVNGYYGQYYIVQPGSSSACLGDITTTYSYASYVTTSFQSYTQRSPSGNPFYPTSDQQPTIEFPTNSFPTITVNSNLALAATSTTTTSAVSSTSSSPHKTKKAVIAGGVVGGAALVLTLAVLYIFLWNPKQGNSHSGATFDAPTVESEPKAYSGLVTSQPRLAYLSAPVLPSSGPIDTVHRGSKFTPNIGQMTAPFVARSGPGTLPSHPSDTAGPISSSAPITPPVAPKPEQIAPTYRLPEQSTSESSENLGADLASALGVFGRLSARQQQALIASLNAAGPAAPEAPLSLTPPPELSTSEVAQEEPTDVAANVLGVISRARLGPRERHTLLASLNTLLAPDQATPADFTRGNTISPPPPYAG